MSEAEKSAQATERQVGLAIAPGLAAQIQTMQQVAQQFVQNYIESLREAMKAFHEMVQRIIEPVKEMMKAYATTFRFLTTWKPIYYVQGTPAPAVAPERKTNSTYLPATIDQYGFFVIDGEPMTILHTRTSRTGKILRLMIKQRSNLITYQEFDEAVKTGTFRKDFRDLKYQLKQQGIGLDYTLIRTEGIALKGLTKLQ